MECVKHAGTEMRLLLGTKVCDACEATSQFERGYRCVGCRIDYALDGITPLREFEAAQAKAQAEAAAREAEAAEAAIVAELEREAGAAPLNGRDDPAGAPDANE